MGKFLIKGSILASIILFFWMMISWMVLPWHCTSTDKFTNESAVSTAIMENTTKDGIYILPNICLEKNNMEMQSDSIKNGPIIFSAIRRNGFDVTSPAPYIISFIIQWISALFVTYLLSQIKNTTYGSKVMFVTLFGITAGILSAFPNWNWWGFSFGYVLVDFLDLAIGWFLAGLAIAALKK